MDDWKQGGFGLYIHWPFCHSKCPYCDFNSHVAARVDQKRWKQAYLDEIDRIGRETTGRILDTIFFGGGTPSLMDPDVVAAVIERVRTVWPMRNEPEITLEANPTTVEVDRFFGFRDAGINRLSLGVQALNDQDLIRLGRRHTAAGAIEALRVAQSVFDRVSFDLIYARQAQSADAWRQELSSALLLGASHLSLYQLTIEDGTAFGDRFARGGLRGLPNEDLSTDLYQITQELTEKAGLNAYEVSNHARTGEESRHNQIYWRGGDYIGIGPGAHGRLTLNGHRTATEAPKGPEQWLQLVESGLPGEGPRQRLSAEDHATEYLLMSLRLKEGTQLARHHKLSGKALSEQTLGELKAYGLLEQSGGQIFTTPSGRLLLNAVLRALTAD